MRIKYESDPYFIRNANVFRAGRECLPLAGMVFQRPRWNLQLPQHQAGRAVQRLCWQQFSQGGDADSTAGRAIDQPGNHYLTRCFFDASAGTLEQGVDTAQESIIHKVDNTFSAYPNPFSDQVNILRDRNKVDVIQVTIYNLGDRKL